MIPDHIVQKLRNAEGQPLPRVTLGAVNREGSLFSRSFGDETAPGQGDVGSVHWIASCTKVVTTIAVLHCVERGLLKLDSDISTVLPEWKDPKILIGFDDNNEPLFRAAQRCVTLRHLLTHSSGMAYPFMHPLMEKYFQINKLPPFQTRIRDTFPKFLVYEPGEKWRYSSGMEWAGLMVEAVNGGMKLGEYMQQHLFEPLGIQDATFHLEQRPDLRNRKAKFWERDGPNLRVVKDFWYPDPVEDDIGGGGLYMTMEGLLKLFRGLLQGKLLRPETLAEMRKPQLENRDGLNRPSDYPSPDRNAIYNAIPDDVPADYGLGGLLNTSAVPGGRADNSLTWSGFPNCYWWLDLKSGIAGVLLSQLQPTGDAKAVELLAEFEKAVYTSILVQ